MDASQFMPHGMCYLWQPKILIAQITADAIIALAYFSIPVFLIWVVRKRGDLPFSWVFWMFAIFIVSCGTTHLASIWVIWHPDYWAEACVKWITAVSSIGTAVMLVPLTPKILRIRSPKQTEEILSQLRREHSIATSFQNASLPKLPERLPGLEIDAMYRPAVRDLEIGGDWYDAFELIDGRVLVSIGDVAGKGLEASVVMSKVRQAIRVASQMQIDPAAILDAADGALRSEYPDTMVTAFVGIFDRVDGVFVYASAGHPGPLVRHPDGRLEALDQSSLPLGLRVRDDAALAHSVLIREDTLFVFYTDGLTEATHDVELGERRFRAALTAPAILDAVNPAAQIYDRVIDGDARDDVAVLTVRITPFAGDLDVERWSFDAYDAGGAEASRHAFIAFLQRRGVGSDDLAAAELVFAELIGNVVRYAPGRVDVRAEWYRKRATLHVIDEGPGFQHVPRLPRDIFAESGRGLYLVGALTEHFHISRNHGRGSHARAVLALAPWSRAVR
jgi:anti-sigma regulatory factor (Ser/Thr protein kinase)